VKAALASVLAANAAAIGANNSLRRVQNKSNAQELAATMRRRQASIIGDLPPPGPAQ
jgi:hypothetical protein